MRGSIITVHEKKYCDCLKSNTLKLSGNGKRRDLRLVNEEMKLILFPDNIVSI